MKPYLPMTPEQVTRGIAMRHYAWGKRIKQIADEAGVDVPAIYRVLKAEPFSEAVRARLEGYLRTPAGPSALLQDNDRKMTPDSARFAVLRRVLRTRRLAQSYGLPICDRNRLKKLTNTELRVYFYNLSDRVKRAILELDLSITRHWKLADEMEPWEFIERIDLLRAARSLRNAERDRRCTVPPQGRPSPPAVVQLRG